MSDNTEKLAKLSAKLEAQTDYYGARILAFPYSWIIVLPVVLLAAYGAVKLFM